jgi:hypothetical protein
LDLFYIHLKCRKYKNNFWKFEWPKRKTTFFYLELELVHRKVGEQGGSGEQGTDGSVAWARLVGLTVRARTSSGAAGAAPAIDGLTNGEGTGRGER